VISDDECTADIRHVLQPTRLDPEPLSVQRAQRLHEHLVSELGIETEVINLVVARKSIGEELAEVAIIDDLIIVNDLVRLRPGVAD
jgi:hypothetical protein